MWAHQRANLPARIGRALPGEDKAGTTALIKCIIQHKPCLKTNTNKNHGGAANTETISSKALSERIQYILVILY